MTYVVRHLPPSELLSYERHLEKRINEVDSLPGYNASQPVFEIPLERIEAEVRMDEDEV